MTSFPLLHTIHSPEDLRALPSSSLSLLSHEIRQKIISVVSQTGGHLSSNLGVVELTVALHYVFSSPQDSFIFDTGHQTYTHKLLTGRNHGDFQAIRHDHGLSGFSNPQESPHDLFFSGHAGNALSLALGLARVSSSHVIPIIGDASFSCGLTLEALNNIPSDISKLIVILNDNNMSISENVGTLSNIISKRLRIPASPHHEKGVFTPEFFETFNLAYTGPIDGHNFQELIPALQKVQHSPHPVVVHVCTTKGKGFEAASKNPSRYHGIPAAQPPKQSPHPTFPKIFGQTLCSMGEIFQDLHVVVPAMSLGSCVDAFKERFPDRYIDVGIAEGHAVTYSAGIVRAGAPAICSIYSTFLQRAFDNIFHDVCLQSLSVVFAVDRAGLSHGDGRSHHGIYDLSFLRAMPELIICQPRNAALLQELFFSSLQWQQPVAIRYPNLPIPQPQDPSFSSLTREIGHGDLLSRGEDVLIIALGHMCTTAMQVKETLEALGMTTTVMDPVFIKPLDEDLLHQVLTRHSIAVVIEEHAAIGGLGSAIYEFMAKYHLHIPFLHCAIGDLFVDHGERHTLLKDMGLTHQAITQKVLAHMQTMTLSSSSTL